MDFVKGKNCWLTFFRVLDFIMTCRRGNMLETRNYQLITLITIIVPLTLFPLFLLLLVRLRVYIVNLYVFYSYSLIGKLTVFFQTQEFSFRNLPVDSSTTVVRLSPHISSPKSVTSSPRGCSTTD